MPTDLDQQISRLRHACGCREGMVAMLLSVAGYITYLLLADSPAQGASHHFFTGLGLAFGGALVGKLAGLAWSHIQLRRLLEQRRQHAQLTTHP